MSDFPSIDPDLFSLFCTETETGLRILNQGLLELENRSGNSPLLEELMRAAHSIKGAARIIHLLPVVKLAHSMEDFFVALQENKIAADADTIDRLLEGIDFLESLIQVPVHSVEHFLKEKAELLNARIERIENIVQKKLPVFIDRTSLTSAGPLHESEDKTRNPNRILRIAAQSLNRLTGLAAESTVESHRLEPFIRELYEIKKIHDRMDETMHLLDDLFRETPPDERQIACREELQEFLQEARFRLMKNLDALDTFSGNQSGISERLYQEAIHSRMRPFAEGLESLPRTVRDLGRQLGKEVKLEIVGKDVRVDREILEKLEAPINHLIRNAIDHGIEKPEERIAVGKPREGFIKLEAFHRAGTLRIVFSDDGKGVDPDLLKKKILEKWPERKNETEQLSNDELLNYLCLPGFSESTRITDISGRGFGLNIVRNMAEEVGGSLRIVSHQGAGVTFFLRLPVTLSIMHVLTVLIAGEKYAFPLARIDRAFKLNPTDISGSGKNRRFEYEGKQIPLIDAREILELPSFDPRPLDLSVVILSNASSIFGIEVDSLIGEAETVVQELDSKIGKTKDILAGGLDEEGSPILIIDPEELIASISMHLL